MSVTCVGSAPRDDKMHGASNVSCTFTTYLQVQVWGNGAAGALYYLGITTTTVCVLMYET